MKERLSLEAQLSSLQRLDRPQLQDLYRQLHREPPKRYSLEELRTTVGYQLQKQLIRRLRLKISKAAVAAETIVGLLSTDSRYLDPTGSASGMEDGDGSR